jgi:hypothetical protein
MLNAALDAVDEAMPEAADEEPPAADEEAA